NDKREDHKRGRIRDEEQLVPGDVRRARAERIALEMVPEQQAGHGYDAGEREPARRIARQVAEVRAQDDPREQYHAEPGLRPWPVEGDMQREQGGGDDEPATGWCGEWRRPSRRGEQEIAAKRQIKG